MKRILSRMRRAIEDYHMIEAGDRIAVGVSGGKDSLTALMAMKRLQMFYPKPFYLEAITIDMGFDNMDFSDVAELCRTYDIPYYTEKSEIKSVSRGSTFSHNLSTPDEIIPALSPLVDEVAATLRQHNLKGYVVHLQIKDPLLHTISRQMTLPHPTYLYREIMDAALLLLKTHWPLHQKTPIRALTVGVGNLCDADTVTEQLSLFDDAQPRKQRENQEKLEKTIDAIRKKMGRNAISFGFHQEQD